MSKRARKPAGGSAKLSPFDVTGFIPVTASVHSPNVLPGPRNDNRVQPLTAMRRHAMHEFIPSPDDVLALMISGTITGDDLEPIMDRVEAIMAKHDKIHMFVE